jgi:Holliday junction resolvase-like predicted endonuclease
MLCFIEVKTRTAHDIASAEVRVDSHKRNTVLRRLARQYIRQLPQETAPFGALRCAQRLSCAGAEK